MKTLAEFETEEALAFPHLNRDFTDEQGRLKFVAAAYADIVERLCQLSSDPVKARDMYDENTLSQSTTWARVTKFRALLVANGLLDARQAESVPTEPPAEAYYETTTRFRGI